MTLTGEARKRFVMWHVHECGLWRDYQASYPGIIAGWWRCVVLWYVEARARFDW